jgi:uncharacterized protein YdeI (YjbR/CyaY-like superfamily)
MEPTFFETPPDFRAWLENYHDKVDELWVGYYKKATNLPSITWPESVDQALCFGWIDGLRKSIDEKSYKIRFTPRRPASIWSAVNIKRIKELIDEEQVHPAGLAAYERRKEKRSRVYSYEKKPAALKEAYEKEFKENPGAWANFQSMTPYYRKTTIHWVMSAKREDTQLRRLRTLIESSEKGEKIPAMQISKKK